MKETEHTYLNLIARRAAGEITPDEERRLNEWAALSASNRQTLKTALLAWERAGQHVPHSYTPDTEAAWLKVKARMKGNTPAGEAKVVPLFTPAMLRVAAAVVLLMGIGVAMLFFTGGPQMVEVLSHGYATEVELPDGSRVWMQPGAKLIYPRRFSGDERSLSLTGEAFFEVKRDEQKPFTVNGLRSRVRVLGTSFSYGSPPDATEDRITVVTGKVAFESGENEAHGMLLTAGQAANIKAGSAPVAEPASRNAEAIKTGRLAFDDAPLQSVFDDVERYYGTEIAVADSTLLRCRFTGSFDTADPAAVMEVLSLSVNFTYRFNHLRYTVSGEGCP